MKIALTFLLLWWLEFATAELNATIVVDYDPPTGFTPGPSEYRAASGPVTVTCTATGPGDGNVSYQWSSTCRDCPFQSLTSSSIRRGAVHSGDNGTHTCTASRGESTISASIDFLVVDAGIQLFRGSPRGSLPNNGLAISDNPGSGFRLRIFCRSDSMSENVGQFIGLDGTNVTSNGYFAIGHPQPGEITVENTVGSQNSLTASQQGVYTCRIPLQSGEMRAINIGVYPSGFNTMPSISSLTLRSSVSSTTLTCTSTGSPATAVSWTRDGQPVTIDGNTYQLTQTVTDRAAATYENVLTINQPLTTIQGNNFTCTINNTLGSATPNSLQVTETTTPPETVATTITPSTETMGTSASPETVTPETPGPTTEIMGTSTTPETVASTVTPKTPTTETMGTRAPPETVTPEIPDPTTETMGTRAPPETVTPEIPDPTTESMGTRAPPETVTQETPDPTTETMGTRAPPETVTPEIPDPTTESMGTRAPPETVTPETPGPTTETMGTSTTPETVATTVTPETVTTVMSESPVTPVTPAGVTIGFEKTIYTVTEGPNSNVELCAVVLQGTLGRGVVVMFSTRDDSAKSTDYNATTTTFTYSTNSTRQCITINILDDNKLENTETFYGHLMNVTDGSLIISPNKTQVDIIEDFNEVVTIGFEKTMYTVTEGTDSDRELCAILLNGTLERAVMVIFTTSDGSATSAADFNAITTTFTYNTVNTSVCTTVNILNDDELETFENFFVILTSMDLAIKLSPERAQVGIIEDINDVPTPTLNVTRDPDISVTLRHGDPLSLTCTIQLDPAVDSSKVVVEGTLKGPEDLQETASDPMEVSNGVYQITLAILSLSATPSDMYTCTVTISPFSNISVAPNKTAECILNITVELKVTIAIDYTTPPGFVMGNNEYRAASGPVVVTCMVEGGDEDNKEVQFNWSSTCRDCPFQDSKNDSTNSSIRRGAVHSGDSGTHTCNVTKGANFGSEKIDINVVGAGIHVFNGKKKGSLPNNGLVVYDESDTKYHIRFFCRSDSMEMNVGILIGLDGSNVTTSGPLEISNPQPGEVLTIVNTTIDSNDEGIYTCCIPLKSGEIRKVNIGIYGHNFNTLPRITKLTFTNGSSSSSTLTCTSTGSPATTVTWTRDGRPLIIDGTTYQMTQTVTNRSQSSYENILTINDQLSNILDHQYSCNVSNIIGNNLKHLNLRVNSLIIPIMKQENPTTGRSFSLTCSLMLPLWTQTLNKPTIKFLKPATIADDEYIMINRSEKVSNDFLNHITTLWFTTLQTSHGGQYECQARFRASNANNSTSLNVKIPPPIVCVTLADSGRMYFAGNSLTLICTISLNGVNDLTDVIVNSTWTGPNGDPILTNERINATDAAKGENCIYTSKMVLNPLRKSDTGNYSCQAIVHHKSQFVSSSDPGTSQVMINVKAVTVMGTVSGSGTAGHEMLITCMIGGADSLIARFNLTLISRHNNTVVNRKENTSDTHLNYSFIARVSDAGIYVCNVVVTSTFLNGPILSNASLTLTIQISTPVINVVRDTNMTLRHGDPLNLTCTIYLEAATNIGVKVVGTLSGQGISNGTVMNISERKYRITQAINSLKAERSAAYTCCARASPSQAAMYVLDSDNSCSTLNITVELAVTINILYNPPDDMLGPNEYRAASGPVRVICMAVGGIQPVHYQWSSNCRDCTFQDTKHEPNSSEILRAAVHSGDTGIHTCKATDRNGNTGKITTEFIITGVGIHVFNGVPRGFLSNNGLVVSNDSDSKFHLRFFCRSDSMRNDTGKLIGLNNSPVTTSHPFDVSNPRPGEMQTFINSSTTLTSSHQGVYTCRISMENGDIKEINFGIYPSEFKEAPTVISVIYRSDNSSSTLTCNSINSPPTAITWILTDAMPLTIRDGDSITLDRINYKLQQTVVNRSTSAYTSVLTMNSTLVEDVTGYRCRVINIMGNDSKAVGEGTLSVSITTSGTQIAGENYTLTCSITVAEGVVDSIAAYWSCPGVGMDCAIAERLQEETLGNESTFKFDLLLKPLRQSHDGDYICTAHLAKNNVTGSYTTGIRTAAPLVKVHIPDDKQVVDYGERLTLECSISGVNNLNGTIALHWRSPNMDVLESASSQLKRSEASFSDAGIYTCIGTVNDSFHLKKEIITNDTVSVIISIPSPKVVIEHDSKSTINAGSMLVLTCSITLDTKVAQNEQLIVTNMWTGSYGKLTNETRITIIPAQGTSGHYSSRVMFNTVHVNDSGNYYCQANVSHQPSQFIYQGMNTDMTTITVQAPNVSLSLTSNTTRLPNVPPYNTFSLTCTATAPEGVVSPKTFTWWRNNSKLNTSLIKIKSNKTVQIITDTPNEPVSTSSIHITETTAEIWYYSCEVAIAELINIGNIAYARPIHVTGPMSPEKPTGLRAGSVTADTTTIYWTVIRIAFTPETYAVHYGTSMDMLNSMSNVTVGNDFTAENYRFSITLNALTSNTMYFYYVNTTNTNGSVLSQVKNFTTGIQASPFSGAAAGGVVAAVLIILLLCTAITGGIWWQKKHRKNEVHSKLQKRGPNALDTMISVELIITEDAKADSDEKIEISTFQEVVRNSIPVAEFSNHVSSMHTDENRFETEYNSISKEPLASYDDSKLSCNRERNRFLNIYPYDFSRVKLEQIEGVEGSDYINASFMDGYVKENEYIAAQGPVPESVGDFWRMVWEYKLTTIVMLTKCEERGKQKCEKYWPDEVNQTIEPGFDLKVTLTTLLHLVEYEVRKLTMTDLTNPKEPAHEVTHFYYMAWPDHGVPTDPTSLINFIKRVRKVHPHSTEVPLLVHCSAGVGRTGTFIAIDIEMQRIEAKRVVDVYGCLKKLRSHRVLMVQTLTQYVFIHDTLNELILCGRTDIPAANLRIATKRMHKTVQGKQVTGFEEQFEILQQFCISANKNFFPEATNPFNLSKNRYPAIVAGSHYRVQLKSTGPPGSDYINANFIDGYKQHGAYIATQGPMASTVKSFWRMIWEHQSKCIVMLCNMQEEGEESCYPYWPNKQGVTETHGKIGVTLLSEENFGNYIVRKLEVMENTKFAAGIISPAPVTQFHFLCWPRFGEPSPRSSLVDIIENVTRTQMATGNRAITVMCNDGVGRTGAFICLHAQLERLKTEGVVDCFQFIKSARLNRPGLVQNVGQYILCHEVLTDFVDSFDTYANFKELV